MPIGSMIAVAISARNEANRTFSTATRPVESGASRRSSISFVHPNSITSGNASVCMPVITAVSARSPERGGRRSPSGCSRGFRAPCRRRRAGRTAGGSPGEEDRQLTPGHVQVAAEDGPEHPSLAGDGVDFRGRQRSARPVRSMKTSSSVGMPSFTSVSVSRTRPAPWRRARPGAERRPTRRAGRSGHRPSARPEPGRPARRSRRRRAVNSPFDLGGSATGERVDHLPCGIGVDGLRRHLERRLAAGRCA